MSARAVLARSAPRRTAGRPVAVPRRRSLDLVVKSRRRHLVPIAAVGIALAIAVVFGVILEQVVLAQSAFRLADMRANLEQAEERHQELLLQAAELESTARIESIAKRRLGMVAPSAIEYIVADVRARGNERPGRDPTPAEEAESSNAAAVGDPDGESP